MIGNAISKGIRFLKNEQKINGGFPSWSSKELNFEEFTVRNSPFYTSLILTSLRNITQDKGLKDVRGRAVDFLLTQKSKNWTFNYWEKKSPDTKNEPYPDDLDDTFCALAALHMYKKEIIKGDALARIVEILTLLEVKEGGPYKTWVVPQDVDEIWKDVDIAVNSNIAFFLSLIEIDLPNITRFVDEKVKNKKLISPYYYTQLPVIYFISRFYSGKYKKVLLELILQLRTTKNTWGNPLLDALAISSILNFERDVEAVDQKMIANLLSSQQKDGGWNAYPFVIEKVGRKEKIFAGSKALTTAFCIEALNKYESLLDQRNLSEKNKYPQQLRSKIWKKVEDDYRQIDQTVWQKASKILVYVKKMDEKNHISLLPWHFKNAIGKDGNKIPDRLILTLGVASAYGWIAYTIYDDLLDKEGKVEMLPIANIALRNLTRIYIEFSKDYEEFGAVFDNLMNKIESANLWEELNTKNRNEIPKYTDLKVLCNKSIGIALAPLAILFFLGFHSNSKEVKHVLAFFENFLIAKQLNDDAHDWEEDLSNGQMTPVVARVMKHSLALPKRSLQEIFWYEVIGDVCKIINFHVGRAQKELSMANFDNPKAMENLLTPIAFASKKAIEERRKTIDFLASYEPSQIH